MLFSTDNQVEGTSLIDFLNWAQESFEWTIEKAPLANGVLALPPIQRNVAWNPRQVVDLWDSVFRGLPLGVFMLQRCREGDLGRGIGADARISN